MRILKLKVKNFRQLKNVEIDFNKNTTDLHVFIGRNGSGKSNIMNVINWCLYNDEPHLSTKSKALPLLNLNAIENNEGQTKSVEVELWVQIEKNKKIVFNRTSNFEVKSKGLEPKFIENKFVVRATDESNNTQLLEGDEADVYVNRFVPLSIREFFFFDGERLDKYFIDATGEKIRQASFEISQIYLLQLIEKRLTSLSKDLSKEAGRSNPGLEEINKRIEKLDYDIAEYDKHIEEYKNQITTSKEEIKNCTEFLAGIPDIEQLEKRREELRETINNKKNNQEEKLKRKQDLIMDYSKLIYLSPIMKETIELIKEKRTSNQLPPNVDSDMLKKIIKTNNCMTCNRELDRSSLETIKEMLEHISLSSTVAQELISIENPLLMQYEKIDNYENDINLINKDIKQLEKDLQSYQDESNEIDKKLGGFVDKDRIKETHNRRKLHEELLDKNKEKLWNMESKRDSSKSELDKAKKERKDALNKDKKQKKLNKQFEFCQKATEIIYKSQEVIMDETRKKIEKETKETFFNLVWKKNTFKDVIIDEKYNINLIHNMGYECLGSISAAERELLALSFTLALHNVSGFQAPLIIDTPVARVSDTNRENFAKVLQKVSENKQTILLFTPDEYSDNVKQVIDDSSSTKFKYVPADDERETKIEVL